jgi:hypothetical protein
MKSGFYSKFPYLLLAFLLCFIKYSHSETFSDDQKKSQASTLTNVYFSQLSEIIEVYDYVEIVIHVDNPDTQNPFRDVSVTGNFGQANNLDKISTDGFCDSDDGSVFRIRFMPKEPGDYSYTVTYWQNNLQKVHSGNFKAVNAKRRGIVQVDPKYPWHFIWKGTGEHYFLNGTTAFLLMGWDDEHTIFSSINRLKLLDINRIRVLLAGRSDHFWTEPIKPGLGFHADINPWSARFPDDFENPGIDFTRFNVLFWQKFERMLKHARENDVIISVILGWRDTTEITSSYSIWTFRLKWIMKTFLMDWEDTTNNLSFLQKIKHKLKAIFFGWDDLGLRPSAGSYSERLYLRYAVARLSAYSNITWDLGDDLDGYRDVLWTHETGTFLNDLDSYNHLVTSHPRTKDGPQDRQASWFGMTSFQQWERPQHEWTLEQRNLQSLSGRIIPQVNEEYGYEDHYPEWAPYKTPGASADANRRTAWEIAMAGGYQTTGESAKRGTGVAPDTGGGWVNGRGDNTMTMLKGYAHMVHFFASFDWWKTEPHDELVNNGAFCLANPGYIYVIYLPHGRSVTATLEPGEYEIKWFNPRSGEVLKSTRGKGTKWESPLAPDQEDWAILITSP